MWMLFDGRLGTCGASLGFLDAAADGDPDCRDSGLIGLPVAWATALAATSGLSVGRGGGYGEMEMLVTDAECAW